MNNTKLIINIVVLTLLFSVSIFAQQTGTISGQVSDSFGDALVGATVLAVDENENEKSTISNSRGEYTINGLVPGKYKVRATAENFSLYEATDIIISPGENEKISIAMVVEAVSANVEVLDEGNVNTDAQNNASSLVLKGADLDALPDDPDDLEQALQALAGGAAGPNGGQIYIDGFTGGNIPPKDAIREIRVNQNPFSAEYDRLGFGRIEILTKPGSDKWRGQAFFNFGDSALNARNPFSLNKADSQRIFYGANVSGPIVKNKSSFFLAFDRRQIDDGTSVTATIVDSNFNIVPFQQEFIIPNRRLSINPRFDYQINSTNTLVGRYEFERSTRDNFGVGGFSLPSRATSIESTQHTFQLTETAILNDKTVNETRFQYQFDNRETTGDNTIPAINVLDSFYGGGSSVGFNYNRQSNWEIQNYTTTALGKDSSHAVKFGARIRGVRLEDRSESNYGGTYTFTGFTNPGDPFDLNNDGRVSSIEQYRAKLLGATDVRYNPSQFSITAGEPLADISQYDVGLFATDDWRVNPGLTLSFGLRYENQSNINDNFNIAPRFSFAYSPGAGGAKSPKTVFRGGFGIFYDRFGENYSLQAQRLNGFSQQQYIITANPTILGQSVFSLNGVTNVPTAAQLANIAPLTSTPRIIADDLQSPYTIQGAFSVERQLPGRSNVSLYYVLSRNLHLIRSRNINAPVCPTGTACPINDPAALQLLRPDPTQGNLYQYESSGVLDQQQLIVSFRTFFSQGLTLFSNYRLSYANGTDGGFPQYSYNLDDEYSDSSLDQRHFFFLGGSVSVPYGVSLRPFIIGGSGRPFNVIAGRDLNGDSIFNDRPTFAQLSNRCGELGLTDSFCDVSGFDPNAIVTRNFGRGPSFFTVNLSVNKNFGFGKAPTRPGNQSADSGGRGGFGGGRRGGGGGRGGGGFFGGNERKPYNLSVGVRFSNLLNTNNMNSPIGNLNSPRFGQSTDTAGGFGRGGGGSGSRSIEFNTRFSW
ncbi:MAG: carboxypeptidase regulatory-like domain-containing protein [Acidobacteriota bacterium]|nr:carboxypeptidase regulatory-like domain-containing protein [Acidobacteriota bacterium]